MRTLKIAASLVAVGLVLMAASSSFAQQEQPTTPQEQSTRKIVNRVAPVYPELARTMNVSGMVKLEATVGSNGLVKNIEIKGGHPLLVQAAETAVRKWKWEPTAHATNEVVEFRFDR